MFRPDDAFQAEITDQPSANLKAGITANYAIPEADYVQQMLDMDADQQSAREEISTQATSLIAQVRASDNAVHMVDALLLEYSLDTQEGILLMCLAEALMRIPDDATAEALISDRLGIADWKKHLKSSDSVLVNSATWGLMLTGKMVTLDKSIDGRPGPVINRLVKRMGEPVIRQAMHRAMGIMGRHFVLGRTIKEAFKNGRKNLKNGYTYSFDMLGEAALTAEDSERYRLDYLKAIEHVGEQNRKNGVEGVQQPSVSIKLSALHPRYEVGQRQRVMTELSDAVMSLLVEARKRQVGITIDAEEMDRLELSLDLFEQLYRDERVRGWGNFGLVVQAYSKRALPVLVWLAALSREQGDRIPVRLVKGAYWDSEIKECQKAGLDEYPVFTRKESTDLSYLVCARFMFTDAAKNLYPQFATHNAHTVAAIGQLATSSDFEFQRLHGMGDALYNVVLSQMEGESSNPIRIYAPVGAHADLLPYLVRRLLENGANSSFVHRLVDARTPISDLVQHPVDTLLARSSIRNSQIPLPTDIYGDVRRNSKGVNIDIESQWAPFSDKVNRNMSEQWEGGAIVNGSVPANRQAEAVVCPYDTGKTVGQVYWAQEDDVTAAIDSARAGFERWNRTPVAERAAALDKMADLMEADLEKFTAMCHLEAGKIIQDGIDEVREAVDFCRYYADQARQHFAEPLVMPGPTGESNELYLEGRGVFACISPWNFPLAIFIGQISAALVSGNAVVAKPAEQTTLIASHAIRLFHQAGIPTDVLHLLPGVGPVIGQAITSDPRIAGVAFTGSTGTAQRINQTLAAKSGAIAPLIAETGGQNAMIVDSTALPEQVIKDVVHSAFTSAGQRCSALRVLYVQQDIAENLMTLLKGAMDELTIGDPSLHETDIGPVIDDTARQRLLAHIEQMNNDAELIYQTELPAACSAGHFVAPIAFRIEHMSQLEEEHFGPILHVITYKANKLDDVIAQINDSGYGLTLGIHTRNETTARYIDERVHVGNVYINRDQIGAVVGVQPFGGQGLSGTGPKAGGPRYLYRFATERTRTINTTAVGGNATLLSLESESV